MSQKSCTFVRQNYFTIFFSFQTSPFKYYLASIAGASKGDNVVKFEDSEDDDWSGKQSDKRTAKEDKKETSVLGRVFNKSKPAPATAPPQKLPTRKIVGERWNDS